VPASLFTVPGQRFGYGVVTEPEVRVRDGADKRMVRCARLRCEAPVPGSPGQVCGTVYLAQIGKLYRGERKSCGCVRTRRSRRRPGGRVQKNYGGWTVWVYVGWFKNREQAEEVAARSRAVLLSGDAARAAGKKLSPVNPKTLT
jgi:hypothetical protein